MHSYTAPALILARCSPQWYGRTLRQNGSAAVRRLKEGVLVKHVLRRTKREVLRDMPKKEEMIVFCEMTERQCDVYKRVLASPDCQLLLRKDELCPCGRDKPVRDVAETLFFQIGTPLHWHSYGPDPHSR